MKFLISGNNTFGRVSSYIGTSFLDIKIKVLIFTQTIMIGHTLLIKNQAKRRLLNEF